MTDAQLAVPQGVFELHRHRATERSPLRAWDAADELLLQHLHESPPPGGDGSWVIVNDGFGALAVALAPHRPASWSDSVVAHRAAVSNLERNGLDPAAVTRIPSTAPPPQKAAVVAIKIPRTLSLLEHQLRLLHPTLAADTQVIAAGMTKTVHRSTLELFERVVGPTSTSLARKRARLVFAQARPGTPLGDSPFPTSYELPNGHLVVSHAGVFSRERLDAGTRVLLDHLPELGSGADVVDLGCGSGVIGLHLGLADQCARVNFSDTSYLAIASAQATWANAFGTERSARFEATDALEPWAPQSLDLVVVNPPFHDDRGQTDAVAWHMFLDAWRVLRPGGRLVVVANRHLAHHVRLRRVFGTCTVTSGHPKFVVLEAVRGGAPPG